MCDRQSRGCSLLARSLLLIPLFCAASVRAHAQDALVLSGGGARGIAHAGVLLGLAERGHSPDIVVGTSMGAIVGALYAAGYPPDTIAAVLDRQDWRAIFSPDAITAGPLRTTARPLLSFAVGDETRVYGGFVPDVGINRRLVELLFDAGARARSDFDRLPRRYRAIAADLLDGTIVPIASGDLARATRASMAVPGVFSPIVIDGRTLVDGGIADNLPIEQARALGASYVIASDVLNPFLEPIPASRVAIGVRAIRILIENASPDGAPPDISISPRIPPSMSAAGFPTDSEPLFDIGLEAALAALPERGAELPPRVPAALDALADTVVVEGVGPELAPLVRAAFAAVVGGEYDAQRVLRRVNGLYATGMFRGVWPRVEERGERATLIVNAEPVPASILALSLGVDDRRRVRGLLTMRQRLEFAGVVELRATAQAHRFLRLGALELSRPFARRADVAVTGSGHFLEQDVPLFVGDSADAHVFRLGGWIGGEWRSPTGRRVATLQWIAERVNAGEQDGFSTGPTLRWIETPAYPQVVGAADAIEATLRFGAVHYTSAHARASVERGFRNLSVAVLADIAAVTREAPADALFALGATDGLPWLDTGEQRGARRAIFGVDVAYPILLEGAVRARVRAGAAGDRTADLTGNAWHAGAELGAIWPTPLGVLAAGFAFGDEGETRFTLDIGSVF